jgi:MFS family permease
MSRNIKVLLGLLLFNSISAIGGGIALLAGSIKQPELVPHTSFNSLYFPGVILLAIVGGSSLIAVVIIFKNTVGWQLASIVAGVIMLFWIIGKIVSTRSFHWLQLIYLITALAIINLNPNDNCHAKRKV